MSDHYDVIIVGGGCVGGTLACALGKTGLRVAVIENREPETDWPADTVDLRVFAITRASQSIFENIGVWDGIRERGVSPYREMQVWDAGGQGKIHFDAADLGEPLLGHIIEQRVIQAALHERMQALSEIDHVCPAAMQDFDVDDTRVLVRLEGGDTLTGSLLVGADGAGSRVRELAGIGLREHDYRQTAVVAVVATERPHAETAWQRFLPTGPLAFLPLGDGRSSIVWSTAPEEAERLCGLTDEAFCVELGEAFDHRLGAVTAVGERGRFPLRRLHAERYVQQRLALVGDAAHVIHPLAGQGVNLGLLDVAALAEVVGEARRDIGDYLTLRRYERWRRSDNEVMQYSMDGFKHLFGSALPPVRLLRNLGLDAVDRLSPLKSLLARRAMGREGDLPRLARPDF